MTPWHYDTKLPDGHRLFHDGGPAAERQYAIADDSGRAPEATDDGVLFMDRSRPLEAGRHCAIPLVSERDEQLTRTPTTPATVLLLAARFDWRVSVPATRSQAPQTYYVTQVTED